jgi:hypothetical protein
VIDSPRLARQLLRIERVLANQPLEHLFAFAPDGRFLLHATSGLPSRIWLSSAQKRQLAGAVVTHNHPGGRSLSEMDLDFAMDTNLLQVRAVTRWARYHIDRPQQGWTPFVRRAIRSAIKLEHPMVLDHLWRDIRAQEITREDADLLYEHLLWKRMAERGLLQYGVDFWHVGATQ